MALAAFAGKLYALGGRINSYAHNTDETDVYDPVLDRWSRGAPMPTARSGSAAAVWEGRILVIGGESPRGVFDQNEAYDPQTGSWSTSSPLPSGRHGMGAAVWGDRVFVPGGGAVNGGAKPTTTLWAFGP
jgi:N-acetylneuraminic acid mutarotase